MKLMMFTRLLFFLRVPGAIWAASDTSHIQKIETLEMLEFQRQTATEPKESPFWEET